jgi:hypothetical protein
VDEAKRIYGSQVLRYVLDENDPSPDRFLRRILEGTVPRFIALDEFNKLRACMPRAKSTMESGDYDRLEELVSFNELALVPPPKAAPANNNQQPPPQLPEITIGPGSAEIIFNGETFQNVNPAAAEALRLILAKHPVPVGLTAIIGSHPSRTISKLPPAISAHVKPAAGNKGYQFHP